MPEGFILDFEAPIRELERRIEELSSYAASQHINLDGEIEKLKAVCAEKKREIFSNLTPWQHVQLARHQDRPSTSDYIRLLFTDFFELHGDRSFGDDRAIVCGFAKMKGKPLLFVGHRKGRTTRERLMTNFGCAHPEGYRKALQKMKLAEKFRLPVVCFIDTPGAYPGIGAEERGQAQIIARNLLEMARLRIPLISLVIGEGGSGGALGIGVTDRILIQEHAYYSVISPEGCAAILWKTNEKKAAAAEALRISANDLRELGIAEEIIPEPLGGAHCDPKVAADNVKTSILRHLDELGRKPVPQLLEERYAKYRRLGKFLELPQAAAKA
ncbi:MAG: acetyl-CoA carboxylase carboxyltransferase subunit alpha [Planctomycetota bacterium]